MILFLLFVLKFELQVIENKFFKEILINHEIWRKIDKTLYKKHLKKILICKSKKELVNLFLVLEIEVGKAYLLKLLSLRGYMENELSEKLKRRYFEETSIQKLFLFFRKLGYLKDKKEALLYIENHRKKGWGPRVIQYRLERKLGNRELAEKLVLKAFPLHKQKEEILIILQKRFLHLSEPKEKKHAFSFLLRRGFDRDLICLFLV